jgi:hypothetical protein
MRAPREVTWREGVGKGRLGASYGGTLRIRKEYRLWSCNPTSHTLACLYFSSLVSKSHLFELNPAQSKKLYVIRPVPQGSFLFKVLLGGMERPCRIRW